MCDGGRFSEVSSSVGKVQRTVHAPLPEYHEIRTLSRNSNLSYTTSQRQLWHNVSSVRKCQDPPVLNILASYIGLVIWLAQECKAPHHYPNHHILELYPHIEPVTIVLFQFYKLGNILKLGEK